jgi:uncharacterized membrane protein
MSEKWMDQLEKELNQYDVSKAEKQDILEDYNQMIEDGKQRGLSQEAIMKMLGSPEKMMKELGYHKKNRFPGGEKLIALSPFISLTIFMILGLTKGLWHPGWLIFLLIPVTAIIVEMGNNKEEYLLTALSPFISMTVFLVFGFFYDIWHPTWLIFIIVPLFGVIESKHEMDSLSFYTALSPFVSFIAFMVVGHFTGAYHLAWLLLLTVAVLGIFQENQMKHRVLLLISLIISVGLYLILGYYVTDWIVASLAFLLFVVAGIFTGFVGIEVEGINQNLSDFLIVLFAILSFLAVGYFFDLWAVSWLCLLLIPVLMIIKYREKNDEHLLTSLSPFLSITIFILLGYFYQLWHIAWLAFLLIPIMAIIEDND